VDVQDTPCPSKALVPAAKVDGADAVLAKHGGAHDTRFNGDIEIGLVENLDRVLGQDAGNRNELSVTGAIQGAIRLIHTTTDDFAVLDKDTADWCFITLQSKLGLLR
jgi:hypothetical protein